MSDPNKLSRQSAGSYRTADERFEVRGEANRWFLVDTQQTDDLGQELVRGPFATLGDVREAIPEARRTNLRSLAGEKSASSAGTSSSARSGGKAAAGGKSGAGGKSKPTPKPSWIDRLPSSEASTVRRLIKALEKEGVADAEAIVRRDREGLAPEVARTLIEHRFEQLLEQVPETSREALGGLIRQVAAVLTVDGTRQPDRLPGWLLVELGPEPVPPNRRITLPD